MTAAWLMSAALASAWATQASAPPADSSLQGEKPFGALVVETGSGGDWKDAMSSIVKGAGKGFPIVEASADDPRQMQEALDRLALMHVKKIVVVPLELSSYSVLMDQLRYLLGIRKDPSAKFLLGENAKANFGTSDQTINRLAFKLPVVLAGALDDDDALADILLSRAKALSKNPSREALLLLAEGSKTDVGNSQWFGAAQSLAGKVRASGKFAAGRAFALPADVPQDEREKSLAELRKLAKTLRRDAGGLIVVPLTLGREDISDHLPAMLDGIFFKFDGKPILPDARLGPWVKASAAKASTLPDMRNFKDKGRPIPQAAAAKLKLNPSSGAKQ